MVFHILDSPEIIIKKIMEKGIGQEDLQNKIRKKQEEYGGLLTEAGAAYSIAKEMGIDFEFDQPEPKIKDIAGDQTNINLTAKIESAFPAREFEKDGRKGSVTNLTISDDTGKINVVVWNKELPGLAKGSRVKILNGYVKERNNQPEINIGNFSSISVVEEGKTARLKISELKDNASGEIRATIVDVFKPTILEVCPNCGSMLKPDCPKCGKIASNYSLIVNAELDDGTETIRGTFYRQIGEKFLGITGKELKEKPEIFDGGRRRLLGEEYIFTGQAGYDPKYNRMNFIVRSFNNMDVQKELARCYNG